MKKLTVACVLWEGDFRLRDFSAEWVVRLRNMVLRNLPLPHRFICFTNKKQTPVSGIKFLPLVTDYPGWWSKIELFRSDNGLTGDILFIDLDQLILSDLTPLVSYPTENTIWMWPGRGAVPRIDREGKRVLDVAKSGVMFWNAQNTVLHRIFTEFNYTEVSAILRGDQDWISQIIPEQIKGYPKGWLLKVKEFRKLREGKKRAQVKMLAGLGVFGPNRNMDAIQKESWVKEIWR